MDLLNAIMDAQGGDAVSQIAKKLNISDSDAGNVIGQLAPALGRGLAKNAEASGGLDALLGALQKGNHQRYVDNPALATDDDGVNEGNKILGHILGNKDVSRQLASRAAEQTGVSDGLIKQMLPMIASMAMGALSNKTNEAPESGSALGGLVGAFLGGGGGKNDMVDDLLGVAGSFLRR
ncbi:MAG: DUF937 domain-containing protein [Pseudomonadota bacterium]